LQRKRRRTRRERPRQEEHCHALENESAIETWVVEDATERLILVLFFLVF
jgi:hypothetical protein